MGGKGLTAGEVGAVAVTGLPKAAELAGRLATSSGRGPGCDQERPGPPTLEGMAWLNISRNLAGGTRQDAWVLVAPR